MKRTDVLEAVVVAGISVAALGLAMGVAGRLAGLEAVTADLRMRLRAHATAGTRTNDTGEILLVAIDPRTETQLGRFGTGQWLLRTPFFDQLSFFRRCLKPSVLAYDIIFKGSEGDGDGARTNISQSRNVLAALADAVARLASGELAAIPDTLLSAMSRLEVEQGNMLFAHRLASIMAGGAFPVVLGCHLRGGVADPQDAAVPSWEPRLLRAAEDAGTAAISYLEDLALPDEAVHFADAAARARYAFARNAGLPGADLLDYCYLGAMNVARDDDGVVRRVPLVLGFAYTRPGGTERVERFIPSFALLSVLCHLGVTRFPMPPDTLRVEFGRRLVIRTPRRSIEIPIDAAGRMYLNYTATFDDFAALSFARVAPARAETTTDALRQAAAEVAGVALGRIAVVGVTVTGHDVGATPLEPNIPLVYAQMTAMNNILNGRFLRPLPARGQTVLLASLAAVFTALCLAFRTGGVAIATPVMMASYLVAAYAGVHVDAVILPVVAPTVYLSLTSFGVLTYRLSRERRARRKVRHMFSRMVSSKVLDFLESNPGSFSLRGELAEATVFFSDITGFTSASEHLPPERVTALLNAYLTPVTDCILSHEGYVDKYVGDSVMAVWGAPFPDPRHAVRACRCALAQQAIVASLNTKLEPEYGFRLAVRMGVNSGRVTAGNMGSERKFQYTVIGDVVNFASRLEPVNKELGTSILIGADTYRAVGDAFDVREIGRILVAGKADVVGIYELLGERGGLDDGMRAVVAGYGEALARFHARDWDGCMAILETVLRARGDGPSRFLLTLAAACREHPPAAEWRGEYIRNLKT